MKEGQQILKKTFDLIEILANNNYKKVPTNWTIITLTERIKTEFELIEWFMSRSHFYLLKYNYLYYYTRETNSFFTYNFRALLFK